MVVDDDAISLKLLYSHLSQAGYQVLAFQSVNLALAQIARLRPEMLLLDVNMAEMDGFEACRRLKADPETAAIPVIFVTWARDTAEILRGFEVGAVDYIPKPIQQPELLARVTTHLSLHRLRSQLALQNNQLQREIRERRRVEERLLLMSTHDVLTGLYNRAYFELEIERLQHSRLFPVTLVMADVDDLKQVNDRLGHAAGDLLLKAAAQALRDAFRAEDIVCRIGGDEFAVLLPEMGETATAVAMARLADHLAAQRRRQPDLPLSLSLGAATAAADADLLATLRLADDAMYRAKADHKRRPPADDQSALL
jgi:diguanylate cyclase (GGDEF)-like protein